MKNLIRIFISSLLAGFCIVFGATCYLICAANGLFIYKIIGSFMFGIGLFTIIHFGFWLYTGKVGYVLDNKPNYLTQLLICLIGNILGVMILALFLKSTYIVNDNVKNLCKTIVESKQAERWYEMLTLAFMCGVMIYLAVEGHKKATYPLGKVLFAFMPISLFILCGFEHVVANVCYYVYAGFFSLKALGYFIIMALGNALGSITFDGLTKLIHHLEK